MSEKSLPALGGKTFEDLKQANTHGTEYWSARDLQSLLGYSQWRRFEQAIERAKTSCNESGNSPDHHFAGAGKPITGGKGPFAIWSASPRRPSGYRRRQTASIRISSPN